MRCWMNCFILPRVKIFITDYANVCCVIQRWQIVRIFLIDFPYGIFLKESFTRSYYIDLVSSPSRACHQILDDLRSLSNNVWRTNSASTEADSLGAQNCCHLDFELAPITIELCCGEGLNIKKMLTAYALASLSHKQNSSVIELYLTQQRCFFYLKKFASLKTHASWSCGHWRKVFISLSRSLFLLFSAI